MMLLLALPLLPVIATLGFALVPNDRELNFAKLTPHSSSLAPTPNPFPVPGTDITLDFLTHPASFPQSPQPYIIRVFAVARSYIEAYISVPGNGLIMHHEYIPAYGNVEILLYSSHTPMNPITYSDALSVILGALLKMVREGYRNR